MVSRPLIATQYRGSASGSAGAVAGACHGAGAFPARARATVAAVNDLPLDGVAAGLLGLRAACAAAVPAAGPPS